MYNTYLKCIKKDKRAHFMSTYAIKMVILVLAMANLYLFINKPKILTISAAPVVSKSESKRLSLSDIHHLPYERFNYQDHKLALNFKFSNYSDYERNLGVLKNYDYLIKTLSVKEGTIYLEIET